MARDQHAPWPRGFGWHTRGRCCPGSASWRRARTGSPPLACWATSRTWAGGPTTAARTWSPPRAAAGSCPQPWCPPAWCHPCWTDPRASPAPAHTFLDLRVVFSGHKCDYTRWFSKWQRGSQLYTSVKRSHMLAEYLAFTSPSNPYILFMFSLHTLNVIFVITYTYCN